MENIRPSKHWLNSQVILIVAIAVTTLTIITIVATWMLTKLNIWFSFSTFIFAIALCILSIIVALIVIINYYYSKSLSKSFHPRPQEETTLPNLREQDINLLAAIQGTEFRRALFGAGGAGKTSLLAYNVREELLLPESLLKFSNVKHMPLAFDTAQQQFRFVEKSASPSENLEQKHWDRRASFQKRALSAERQYPSKKKKKKKKKKKR